MSLRKLQLELRQKGITDEAAIKALQDYNETSALQRLIEKKRGRYDDQRKLKQYLMRQGFGYGVIEQVLSGE